MTVVPDVPLTMSDGVVLHANIGYPTDPGTGQRASGTFPVLLTQNPYVGPSQQPDPFFVDRGYIFASVEVRGTLDSQAPNNAPLLNDLFGPRQVQDGVELVDWAAHRLDGSNGAVGLTGCSQLGIIQLFVAAAIGPNSPVKAILPACASNGYDGIYFAGGIPGPTIGLFDQPIVGTISGTKHLPETVFVGGLLKANVLAGGQLAYNGQYWQQRTTSPAIAAQIVANGIPALLWSGWKAPEAMGALEFYAALQNASAGASPSGPMAAGQPTTGRYQVIIGPWGHGQGLDESIELEWYDTWLKGEQTGIDHTSTPMHLFEQGSDVWKNASGYPLTSSYTNYQFGPGTLTRQPQPQLPSSQAGPDVISWGQPGQPGTSLSYTTAPFTAAAELAGPVSASIYASSSNSNMELIATLYDVGPDGTATQLTSGTLLGSMRAIDTKRSWTDQAGNLILPYHPFTGDSYAQAGSVARYDITLAPAAWAVQPGDSLRLTLTTQEPSANCQSLLSALSPAVPCLLTAPQRATLPNGVYLIERAAGTPSSLSVPLLPGGSLATAVSGTTPTSNNQTEPLGW
jgi:predicted acyl esterase